MNDKIIIYLLTKKNLQRYLQLYNLKVQMITNFVSQETIQIAYGYIFIYLFIYFFFLYDYWSKRNSSVFLLT